MISGRTPGKLIQDGGASFLFLSLNSSPLYVEREEQLLGPLISSRGALRAPITLTNQRKMSFLSSLSSSTPFYFLVK
jgi:hypothetical protein